MYEDLGSFKSNKCVLEMNKIKQGGLEDVSIP